MNDHIAKPIVVDDMFATLARWVKPRRPPAGTEPVHGDALPRFSSIDTRQGLDNIGGNGLLYRRVLCLFRDREADFVQRFQAARAAGDADAEMRAAHDLKGTAATLGMHAVQEAAAALERGCMERAPDAEVDAMIHHVSSQLDRVIEELHGIDATRPG